MQSAHRRACGAGPAAPPAGAPDRASRPSAPDGKEQSWPAI